MKVVTGGVTFDWASAHEASRELVRLTSNSGFIAPEDAEGHQFLAQRVCLEIDKIVGALSLKKVTP